MRKLNLGCGQFKKEGYVNTDHLANIGADSVFDHNVFPYPFADGEFDLVEADHVLEHLQDPFRVMREIHRITKPGAEVHIRVPHFSRGYAHPEHEHGFGASFPLYLNPKFKGGYQGVHFESKKIKLTWFAQLYLKKTELPALMYYGGRLLGAPLTFLANLAPYFCDRVWCFWFGGFEEIHFHLIRR